MSLFLKYRPSNFDDTVNQRHIIDILKAQINNWEAMNNYLFFGPRGTGKTSTARTLSRALNCLNVTNWNPCNECTNCKAILNWNTLDFVEIDAASHTQVDNIREEIIEKAIYNPTVLKKKVYIIDEVHMLSKAAFNALLKIMEEPPSYLVFILATTEINKVPETIVSRSLVFNFKKLVEDEIVWRLKYIAEKEWIEYDEKSLYLIAKVSDWAMRDAIKYLEQVSIMWKLDEENVAKFLWVAPDKLLEEFIDTIKTKDINNIFEYLNKLQTAWIDLWIFAKETLMYIDKHFFEDMEIYSKLADIFKNILNNVKYYPIPSIIYKTEFYKNFWNHQDTPHVQPIIQTPKPTEPVISTPTIEKIEPIVEKPVIEESITTKTATNNWDFEKTLHKVVELCEGKIWIKTALKRYSNIESIKDWIVSLIVINQMQYSLLTKSETKTFLEEIFSKILWENHKIHLEYVSKEDYLSKQLI